MKILLACEESQAVCKEFRNLGHEAFSNDILETSGTNPEWHLQGDVRDYLYQDWDLIIAFPHCTDLASLGAAWFEQKRKDGRQQASINFFMLFTQLDLAGFSSFDDGSENSLKEGAFVIEAIRAILCRHYEIYHPFQDLSDKIFTLETDDVSELKVVDSLNIKFRKIDESE